MKEQIRIVCTADNMASSVDWSLLPPTALICILSHVPQWHRLGKCATVCQAWSEAATAATTNIFLEELQDPSSKPESEDEFNDLGTFLSWLQDHGRHVTSLEIFDSPCNIQSLPCPNLRDLLLQGTWVDEPLTVEPDMLLDLSGMTALTSFGAQFVMFQGTDVEPYAYQVFEVLASLPNLQELSLRGITLQFPA